MKPDNNELNGFVKGTLVRVDNDDDWKEIQDIQAGDRVLAIPEIGQGEPAFKRVTNTFKFEQKEIWFVGVYPVDQDPEDIMECESVYSLTSRMAVTPNHPFLVIGSCFENKLSQLHKKVTGEDVYGSGAGTSANYVAYPEPEWKRADDLKFNDVLINPESGQKFCVGLSCPMYKHHQGDQFAWIPHTPYMHTPLFADEYEEGLGTLFDMNARHTTGFDIEHFDCFNELDNLKYSATVYNIEVEDYHTYMVGTKCILVHNTGCGGEVVDTILPKLQKEYKG